MSRPLIYLSLLAATLGVSLLIYFKLSLPQIVTWDEAGYILEGYRIHESLRHFDFTSLYWLTKNQFYYPFFQSWFLALTTFSFDYTINIARLASALLLVPTLLLVWGIGERLKHHCLVTPLLACFFTLTSPLLLFYFSNAMKEGLGLTLSLLTLWLYLLARAKIRWYFFCLTGLALLLLFLTKYNYGLLVLFPISIETLIWAIRRPLFRSQKFLLHNSCLFLPLLLVIGYWLSPPGYLHWFFEILQNKFQVTLYDTTVIGHLLYFPLELAFSYTVSPIAFLLLFIGFIFALKSIKSLPVRLLSLFFLLNFFLAERHMANNQARFIFTSVPALFLVGSFGLTQLFSSLKAHFLHLSPFARGLTLSLSAVISLLALKDLFAFPSIIKPTASHQAETALFYEQDFQNINRYNFSRSSWPQTPPPTGSPTLSHVFTFILSHVNPHQPVTQIGQSNEISPSLFNFYLEKTKDSSLFAPYSQYYVVFDIEPHTRFDTIDYRRFNLPGNAQARQVLSDKTLKPIATQSFPYLGLTVTIYSHPSFTR